MRRLYTEIRIAHKSMQSKNDYEKLLDGIVEVLGYKSKTEWFNAKVLESAKEVIRLRKLKEAEKRLKE